jgi:hypothetical protein
MSKEAFGGCRDIEGSCKWFSCDRGEEGNEILSHCSSIEYEQTVEWIYSMVAR